MQTEKAMVDKSAIDKAAIKEQMAAFLKIPANRITDATPIAGIVPDSFMLVELLVQLQEEYGIHLIQSDIENIHTVSDLTDLVATRVGR